MTYKPEKVISFSFTEAENEYYISLSISPHDSTEVISSKFAQISSIQYVPMTFFSKSAMICNKELNGYYKILDYHIPNNELWVNPKYGIIKFNVNGENWSRTNIK